MRGGHSHRTGLLAIARWLVRVERIAQDSEQFASRARRMFHARFELTLLDEPRQRRCIDLGMRFGKQCLDRRRTFSEQTIAPLLDAMKAHGRNALAIVPR